MTETRDFTNKLASQVDDLKLDEPPEETNWNNLPSEMKEIVVREMDYITRIRFKQCSKSDNYIVESIPKHFKYVQVGIPDFEWERPPECLNSRFTIDALRIDQRGANITITNNENLEIKHFASDTEAYEWACMNFNSIIFKGKVSIDEFTVFLLDYPSIPFSTGSLVKVKKLSFSSLYYDNYCKWVQHFAPIVDELYFEEVDLYPEDSIDMSETFPLVLNAKSVIICNCSFYKDIVERLKATAIHIYQMGPINLKQLIKRWIDEDYPISSACSTAHINATELDELTDDLDIVKRNHLVNGFNAVIRMKNGKFMHLSQDDYLIRCEITDKCK